MDDVHTYDHGDDDVYPSDVASVSGEAEGTRGPRKANPKNDEGDEDEDVAEAHEHHVSLHEDVEGDHGEARDQDAVRCNRHLLIGEGEGGEGGEKEGREGKRRGGRLYPRNSVFGI